MKGDFNSLSVRVEGVVSRCVPRALVAGAIFNWTLPP